MAKKYISTPSKTIAQILGNRKSYSAVYVSCENLEFYRAILKRKPTTSPEPLQPICGPRHPNISVAYFIVVAVFIKYNPPIAPLSKAQLLVLMPFFCLSKSVRFLTEKVAYFITSSFSLPSTILYSNPSDKTNCMPSSGILNMFSFIVFS